MISKKTVVILVIIAVLLASISIAYNIARPGQKISTNLPSSEIKNSGQGKVGVIINPPAIEDRNLP